MPLRHPVGVRVASDRTVHFQLYAPQASDVFLVGDFTHWSEKPIPLDQTNDGYWRTRLVPVPRGVHPYKFVVQGQWIHDPSHPMRIADGFGGWNSVFGLGGPSLGEPTNLRILSLNLHTYQEADPLQKLEQIAFGVASMDIDALALQEVGEHVSDPSRPNAAEYLCRRLRDWTGEPWEQVWRMSHLGFEVYREGIAVLARVPCQEVREYQLSEGRLARNALAATLALKDMRVRLVSVHLSWASAGGHHELETLLQELQGDPASYDALLLAGDFNATTRDRSILDLSLGGFVDVAANVHGEDNVWPTATPQKWQGASTPSPAAHASPWHLGSRIDYHFLRSSTDRKSLRPRDCVPVFDGGVVGNVYQPIVSDHLGVMSIFEA